MISRLAGAADEAFSRLLFLIANAPTLFGPFRRRSNLAYGEDPLQRLDVYVPAGRVAPPGRTAAGRPLIIFWHGGRWEFGDKSEYRFVGAAMAELGFVTIAANYRLYPQVKLHGFMQDAARTVAWARAHAAAFQADPDKIFVMGHSSGAHIAALLSLNPAHFLDAGLAAAPIAGCIGLSGPYDFLPLEDADLQDMFGPPECHPQSQPVTFARADAPPMLLIHGEADRTVWPFNSRHLAAALQQHGVPVTLRVYPKLDHGDTMAALTRVARSRAPVLADIQAFVAAAIAAGATGSDARALKRPASSCASA